METVPIPSQAASAQADTVVLIPEVRIPADFHADVARARKLVRKIEPKLGELRTLALAIRGTYDDTLRALGSAGIALDSDSLFDIVGEAVGWTGGEDAGEPGIWNLVTNLLDGLDELDTTGLTNAELRRGGERDIPVGTHVKIPSPVEEGSGIVTMAVVRRPNDDGLYSLRLVFGDESKLYSAPHEEVSAGAAAHAAAKASPALD